MSELPWFAVRVRVKHEKTVAGSLSAKNYEVFLPVHTSRLIRSGRAEDVQTPLFSGYVFCQIDFSDRSRPIVTTPGVLGIVGFGGVPAPVSDHEIESLRTVITSGLDVEPWPRLVPGTIVRLCRGPLASVRGTLIDVRKGQHLVVSITLLQRSVMVKIDPSWVIPETSLSAEP